MRIDFSAHSVIWFGRCCFHRTLFCFRWRFSSPLPLPPWFPLHHHYSLFPIISLPLFISLQIYIYVGVPLKCTCKRFSFARARTCEQINTVKSTNKTTPDFTKSFRLKTRKVKHWRNDPSYEFKIKLSNSDFGYCRCVFGSFCWHTYTSFRQSSLIFICIRTSTMYPNMCLCLVYDVRVWRVTEPYNNRYNQKANNWRFKWMNASGTYDIHIIV